MNGKTLFAALSLLAATPSFAAEEYRALYRKGVELNKKGDLKGAIAWYSKAIELKKDSADLYYVRGRAYKEDEQLARALEDLGKAIALKPDYADAYNHRGAIHAVQGKGELAKADFRKSCDLGNAGGCANLKILDKNPAKGKGWP
ncbi:MAG TPA: tetratricopeptide repeat protein [Verrucomicrobiae bacterium]|nr:tetratricopeptide repeat protein [Verrucomicrobiae bacterium]